ncbi:MAG: hypothetical protein A2Y72_07760 [Chloroflexi bacterium RBG_13_53_26]|jgi:hypothetical protein|nr:MAG: hypothetical protein A2Y72_07760 [Chloroflexi bacterium RBG_13_53_26]
MNARIDRSSLLGRYDQDAGPWRPMYYGLTINVPLAGGQSESGTVTLNNQPYIWQFLSHMILGNTYDWETTGLMQDGQYMIEFKDEQSNYQNVPVAASAAFGQGKTGYMVEFPFPIPFAGNKTITFRVTNNYTRILTPTPAAPVFPVNLVLGGVADWGELVS